MVGSTRSILPDSVLRADGDADYIDTHLRFTHGRLATSHRTSYNDRRSWLINLEFIDRYTAGICSHDLDRKLYHEWYRMLVGIYGPCAVFSKTYPASYTGKRGCCVYFSAVRTLWARRVRSSSACKCTDQAVHREEAQSDARPGE